MVLKGRNKRKKNEILRIRVSWKYNELYLKKIIFELYRMVYFESGGFKKISMCI